MKEKNWSLWMRLIEIIRRKKIQVNLKKVKAHSGEYLNDKVDRLAKEGRNLPEVNWKDPRRSIWSVLPIWNQIVVDISIREFIKEVHKKETLVEWSQQNRIQKRWVKEIEEQRRFSWDNFWKQCRQGSSIQTSIKQAKERNFRIKLMNDELPTLCNLRKRRPDIYGKAICPLCNSKEEDTGHLFDCPALLNDRLQIWKELKQKVTNKYRKIVEKKDAKKGKDRPSNLLQLIDRWSNQFSNSSQEMINIGLGLFEDKRKQAWNQEARKDGIKGVDSQTVLCLLSNKFLKLFREKIWIPRCKRTIDWEKTQGINSKAKKKKTEKKEAKRKGKSDRYSRRGESQGTKGRVTELVWEWIREGKRWLGF
jgi:hypothetical protein